MKFNNAKDQLIDIKNYLNRTWNTNYDVFIIKESIRDARILWANSYSNVPIFTIYKHHGDEAMFELGDTIGDLKYNQQLKIVRFLSQFEESK